MLDWYFLLGLRLVHIAMIAPTVRALLTGVKVTLAAAIQVYHIVAQEHHALQVLIVKMAEVPVKYSKINLEICINTVKN